MTLLWSIFALAALVFFGLLHDLKPVLVAWANSRIQVFRAQEAQAQLAEALNVEQLRSLRAQLGKLPPPTSVAPPAGPAAPPESKPGPAQAAADHMHIDNLEMGPICVAPPHWPAIGVFGGRPTPKA